MLRSHAAPMPPHQRHRALERDFAANYARISRAVIDGDRATVAREAVRIGYAAADDGPERIDAPVHGLAAAEIAATTVASR